mmetsp:Transcript_98386/g.282878  ORF Transcript_98386/g.282878 Transcript_98386/m.282878 type:complete len:370 (-) Transcript_98386:581-1690(-)
MVVGELHQRGAAGSIRHLDVTFRSVELPQIRRQPCEGRGFALHRAGTHGDLGLRTAMFGEGARRQATWQRHRRFRIHQWADGKLGFPKMLPCGIRLHGRGHLHASELRGNGRRGRQLGDAPDGVVRLPVRSPNREQVVRSCVEFLFGHPQRSVHAPHRILRLDHLHLQSDLGHRALRGAVHGLGLVELMSGFVLGTLRGRVANLRLLILLLCVLKLRGVVVADLPEPRVVRDHLAVESALPTDEGVQVLGALRPIHSRGCTAAYRVHRAHEDHVAGGAVSGLHPVIPARPAHCEQGLFETLDLPWASRLRLQPDEAPHPCLARWRSERALVSEKRRVGEQCLQAELIVRRRPLCRANEVHLGVVPKLGG